MGSDSILTNRIHNAGLRQKVSPLPFLGILGYGLLGGCGDPSATLTIQLQTLPTITRDQNITVQGTVTRSPTKETITVVTVAGGTATRTDSLASPGNFSINVALLANQETQLAITASDAQGSVSEAVIVSIFHDDIGPQIESMSPVSRAENVALDTPIEIEFGEPIVAGTGAQIQLLHNGFVVPGDAVVSQDALRVSFTPLAPLEVASVYQLTFSGFTDDTGNPVQVDTQACFLTELGNSVTQIDTDSPDGAYSAGSPGPSLVPTNVNRIRYSRLDSTMFTLVEFANERTLGGTENNNTTLYIEIDADQNPQTGYTSLRDTLLEENLPDLVSGIGVEYFIGLDPLTGFADSSFVGLMTSPLNFLIIESFNVGICGRYWGFHHTAFLGNDGDDGRFDYSVIAFTDDANGSLAEIVPESGFITVDVTGLRPPPLGVYTDRIVRGRGKPQLGSVQHRYRADVLLRKDS